MNNARIFKRFFLTGAAIPVAVKSKDDGAEKDPKAAVLRPSDLPIYPPPRTKVEVQETEEKPCALEEMVGTVRQELCGLVGEVEKYTDQATKVVKEQWESSNAVLDYLKEEENVLPRSGAIALSGLTGFVFGLRGGFFKRLLYTSIGAGTMASLCYPREAEEFFEDGLKQTRQYALIGYHFMTAVVDDLTGSSSSAEGAPKKDDKS